MAQRHANYAIQGYLYQFCKAIEQLLANREAYITIEGIEDIDLHAPCETTLIQCKYHEEQKFKPSAIYKPVGLMLQHYLDSDGSIPRYVLFAHFGTGTPGQSVESDDFFRKALGHVSDDAVIVSAEQLRGFREKFVFSLGPSYEELKRRVYSSLKAAFSCGDDEVDRYYWNNAIAYTAELSTRKAQSQRRIKGTDFLSAIDGKAELYDLWRRVADGQQAYINLIKRRLKGAHALSSTKRRFLFVASEIAAANTPAISLFLLIQNISSKYPMIGKLYNTSPWTVIVDLPSPEIHKLKSALLENGIFYNDGYESVCFSSQYFDDMPLIEKKKSTNTIDRVSHQIRLLSAETFVSNFIGAAPAIRVPHVFIDTSRQEPVIKSGVSDISQFRLSGLENLSELNDVIMGIS